MLDFYLGAAGVQKLGEYLGGLSFESICWLQKNDFIVSVKSGHLSYEVPESFPPFDDVILSYEQVLRVSEKFNKRLVLANEVAGFNSTDVNTLKRILDVATSKKSGLSTLAD